MSDNSIDVLELVDAPPELAYDNLTRLAADWFQTPVALVSIVDWDRDRQYFKSQVGLSEPWKSSRQTPLSHSFCRHVVEDDATLVVDDAVNHPKVHGNPSIVELGVMAYLGAPIRYASGAPVGALCVIDSRPRSWSADDVSRLERLASCVSDAILLKSALRVSEGLRAEQADFTRAISHEVRGPIDSLHGLLEVLATDAPVEEREELIRLGRATSGHASSLINDVLLYSRTIDRDVNIEHVALDDLMIKVLSVLAADILDSGATVDVGSLPAVHGDPWQLQILLIHLVSNAIRFRTPGDAPRIFVRARNDREGVKLSVRDEGIGIAPQCHERIFRLFRRLNVREEYPGSGLGLSVCRRVAANHHGSIRVHSVLGAGATFTVRLPSVS